MCVILANKNLKEDWVIALLEVSVNLTIMKPIKSLIICRISLGSFGSLISLITILQTFLKGCGGLLLWPGCSFEEFMFCSFKDFLYFSGLDCLFFVLLFLLGCFYCFTGLSPS